MKKQPAILDREVKEMITYYWTAAQKTGRSAMELALQAHARGHRGVVRSKVVPLSKDTPKPDGLPGE